MGIDVAMDGGREGDQLAVGFLAKAGWREDVSRPQKETLYPINTPDDNPQLNQYLAA